MTIDAGLLLVVVLLLSESVVVVLRFDSILVAGVVSAVGFSVGGRPL